MSKLLFVKIHVAIISFIQLSNFLNQIKNLFVLKQKKNRLKIIWTSIVQNTLLTIIQKTFVKSCSNYNETTRDELAFE